MYSMEAPPLSQPLGVPPGGAVDPHLGETERMYCSVGSIRAGKLRLPAGHRLFNDSGPIQNFVVVFPRTAGTVHYEGRRPFFASPLVAPFYNRGQRYIRGNDNPQGDRSDWIGLTDHQAAMDLVAELDPWVADHPDAPLRHSFAPTSAGLYARQRLLMERLASGEPLDPAYVEEEGIAIFRTALRAAYDIPSGATPGQARTADKAESALYHRALRAVIRRFREPVRLSALAADLEVSAPHLSRLFRVHQGTSVHKTLVELRLRDSLEALRDPNVDLSRLALDLGFTSHSHFTATFRRYFGGTPSQVRGRISRRQQRDWAETWLATARRVSGFSRDFLR
jgi:AraC-like DNA-binding protein